MVIKYSWPYIWYSYCSFLCIYGTFHPFSYIPTRAPFSIVFCIPPLLTKYGFSTVYSYGRCHLYWQCVCSSIFHATAFSIQIKTAHLFQYYSEDLLVVTDDGVDVLIHIVLVTRKISDKCTSTERLRDSVHPIIPHGWLLSYLIIVLHVADNHLPISPYGSELYGNQDTHLKQEGDQHSSLAQSAAHRVGRQGTTQ
jgi:hypothetical protein